MSMTGTRTVGTKAWRLGSGGGRRGDAGSEDASVADEGAADASPAKASPVKDGAREEGKLLAKSKASLEERERMLSRQTVLLEELRADGLVTTEAEKSVARLEAALLEQRAAHDGLLAKTGAGNAGR